MPIYSRRQLRQRLGREFLLDTIVGTTTKSQNLIWDETQADPTASGEVLYTRAWARVQSTTNLPYYSARVSSFNTLSGHFIISPTLALAPSINYEIHQKLSPAEKDRALDAVIKDIRFEHNFPIWSIENGHIYSLGDDVLDVVDVKYYSNPTDSLNLGEHTPKYFRYERAQVGSQYLLLDPSLPASYRLIIKALVTTSLQSAETFSTNGWTGDEATIYLPSDDWVLAGAMVRCLWNLEQNSPGQESTMYRGRRREMANMYTKLSRRFQPVVTRKIQLGESY